MGNMGLVVVGAGGRMGQNLIRTICEMDGVELAGAVERAGSAVLGRDAGELAGLGTLGIIGTTGFSEEDEAKIAAAARHATIVKSGNMSLGVNLLATLVKQAAKALSADDFDIEVLEMHHRHKVDAPSGTALLLGQAAADGREIDLGHKSVRVRDGHTGPRESGSIGFATLRGGSVVGDGSIMVAGR